MTGPRVHFLVVIFFAILSHLATLTATDANEYLEAACSVTRHRDLCVHSLAPFSHSTARQQKHPCWWARAGVSVALAEAKSVGRYIAKMKLGHEIVRRGRARRAVADCVECFGDAVAELHSSLGELQRLKSRTFKYQMGNVVTWASAALTYQDTCLDGFGGHKGKELGEVRAKVLNATYFTSNALALLNKLASSGGL